MPSVIIANLHRAMGRAASVVVLGTAALLAGCGGGAVIQGEVVVEQPIIVVEPAAFSIVLRVNGQSIPGINLLPGQEQDIDIPVGSNFELATSGPVVWTVVTGGKIVNPPVGSTLVYADINMTPTFISNARYAANTLRSGAMAAPVLVSFIVASVNDARQEAQINLVLN